MGESVESEVELFTNEVLIGAHVPSVDDPITGKAWITLTGLEEWYDDFHFSGSVAPFPPNPSDPFALTARVRYHAKDSSLFNVVPGRKLKFRSEYHGPVIFRTKKRIEISEQNFLELNFDPAASINDVLYETEIWQYFLAFGRTKPVFFDEFSLLLFDPGRRTARLLVPGRKESASIKPRHPTELLFTRSELGRRLSGWTPRRTGFWTGFDGRSRLAAARFGPIKVRWGCDHACLEGALPAGRITWGPWP